MQSIRTLFRNHSDYTEESKMLSMFYLLKKMPTSDISDKILNYLLASCHKHVE